MKKTTTIKRAGVIAIVLVIALLFSASMASAVGIKWFTEKVSVEEKKEACVPYGAYNPAPQDIMVVLDAEGPLKNIMASGARQALVVANTPSSGSVDMEYCFTAPTLDDKECPMKELSGNIVLIETPVALNTNRGTHSVASISASAPLTIEVACKAGSDGFTMAYLGIGALSIVLLSLLFRKGKIKQKNGKSHEKNRRRSYSAVLLAIVIIGSFILVLYEKQAIPNSGLDPITGAATTANAEIQAVIANYFAITASNNLTNQGIDFNITTLPSTNINATLNYNASQNASINTTNFTNRTQHVLVVSTDSNVNVDYCIKANETLTSGANTIGLTNLSWSNSTTNNETLPALGTATNITTSFVKGVSNIAGGSDAYYRFYLSISASQAAGTYGNMINFKGVQTGQSC